MPPDQAIAPAPRPAVPSTAVRIADRAAAIAHASTTDDGPFSALYPEDAAELPPTFDWTRFSRAMNIIAIGGTLREATAVCTISKITLFRWLHKYPFLQSIYRQARALAAHQIADDILHHAEEMTLVDKDTASNLDRSVRARQWLAERLNPDSYGTGRLPAAIAIQINTNLNMDGRAVGSDEERRAMEIQGTYVVETTVEAAPDEEPETVARAHALRLNAEARVGMRKTRSTRRGRPPTRGKDTHEADTGSGEVG